MEIQTNGSQRGSGGFARALGAGFLGAGVLTALHEGARLISGRAPRMDKVGERGLLELFEAADRSPPRGMALYGGALAGDLLMNGLYYTTFLLGRARRPLLRGGLGGLAAGIGALFLPQLLGLGRPPRSRRADTRGMTIGWYLAGGLAAATAYKLLCRTGEQDAAAGVLQ